jgi:hypothetical protein
MRRRGLRAEALVSGGKDVERVRYALVTTAAPRTVISSRLADRVAGNVGDPWKCSSSPSIGKACGPTARVDVVVDGCRAASVQAVVAQLPRGLDLAIGRDVIEQSVKSISFSTVPATFRCRAPKRRR